MINIGSLKLFFSKYFCYILKVPVQIGIIKLKIIWFRNGTFELDTFVQMGT